MSAIRKVFGIISYFPNNDSEYHIETRRERSRRCSELLLRLGELWPDIDIMIIAQNWQNYQVPPTPNTITIYNYDKLGILGARKELRRKFLDSKYDYLIMLDDDGRILDAKPDKYIQEIDKHPDGVGFIRHTNCPLMLLAISKSIYSQIDMPNINPENGEGFEDDIFVANCIERFSDKWFDFPEDCIKEHSLKYTGPGACPSTWAKENQYDWNNMRRVTSAVVKSSQSQFKKGNTDRSIDVIIPYVNSSDKNWLSDFTKSTGNYSASPVRFRCWGTLKYILRGIEAYMPFVRNVILILARESQMPVWLDTSKVRIVYHNEFIPKKFLPTFNSCTIESFLWNIKGLSDRFLYFNDDMFPINNLSVDDFFTDNIPHILFNKYAKFDRTSMYRVQSRNALDLVADKLGVLRYPPTELILPEHTAAPMLKSTLDIIGRDYIYELENSITKLRQLKNINQYIYQYYHYFTNNYVDSICNYLYIETKDNMNSIHYVICESKIQIICLNDSDKIKDYKKTRQILIDIFEEKFPSKCKYEV